MNNIQIFKNKEFGEVRTVSIDNEVWFVGKDVAQCFGDTNYRRSLARLDEDDKGVTQIDTLINERISKLKKFKQYHMHFLWQCKNSIMCFYREL